MEYDASALKCCFADIGVDDIRRASDDRAGCTLRTLKKTESTHRAIPQDKRLTPNQRFHY